jgi:hypothetical protein
MVNVVRMEVVLKISWVLVEIVEGVRLQKENGIQLMGMSFENQEFEVGRMVSGSELVGFETATLDPVAKIKCK